MGQTVSVIVSAEDHVRLAATGRAMAKVVDLSLRTIQRIWEAHHLQPHRWRTFKQSKDPAFAEKVEDIVGLYMHPPAHAVVLSIDEKRSHGERIATGALTE